MTHPEPPAHAAGGIAGVMTRRIPPTGADGEVAPSHPSPSRAPYDVPMTSIVPVPPSEPTSTDLATTSAQASAPEHDLDGPDRALGFDKKTLGFVVFMVALAIIGFAFMP